MDDIVSSLNEYDEVQERLSRWIKTVTEQLLGERQQPFPDLKSSEISQPCGRHIVIRESEPRRTENYFVEKRLHSGDGANQGRRRVMRIAIDSIPQREIRAQFLESKVVE